MTRTNDQKERRQFNKAVMESSIDDPSEDGKFHPLHRTLKIWGEIHGFESVAANVKWCVTYWNAEPYTDDDGRHRSSHARHATLLHCFGQTFKGSEVGMLGADIVGGVLRRSREIRQAGILVLESWCEDDEDGTWLTMMAEQRERETDPVLKDYCTQVLDNYEWGVGEPAEEPEPAGIISNEEHQKFLDVAEKYRDNVISGHISTERVPKFLEDNLGLHPHLALDLLESYKIEKVSTRSTSINILVGRMHSATGVLLFAWTDKWAFSMRPHDTSDWLIGIFS